MVPWLAARRKALAPLIGTLVTIASHYLTGVPVGTDKSMAYLGIIGLLTTLGVYGVANDTGTPTPAPVTTVPWDPSRPGPVATPVPAPGPAATPEPIPQPLSVPQPLGDPAQVGQPSSERGT